jgi:hypothetical protein
MYGYSINSIKHWARISPSQGPGYHRYDPRGLSIANRKGLVIIFNISITPAEEDEEVPAVFPGISCTFASAGAKIEDFRFLGAESFGSTKMFCF